MKRSLPRPYPIQTDYYSSTTHIRSNHAASPSSAILRAIDHLQANSYAATHCEIFDLTDGTLYAVIKRHIVSSRIEILYRNGLP